MSVLCRILGHEASRGRTQRDPLTFAESSFCKRCSAALVFVPGRGWQAEEDERSVSA